MTDRRVLLIEDDPAYAALLTQFLTGHGYAVSAIDSALGAAALVRGLRPGAILLDLGLPYRSGASLLADLKADPRTSSIPVIIVSALPEALPDDRRNAAAATFAKPFRLQDLVDVLQQVMQPSTA